MRRVLRPEARVAIALRKQRQGKGADPHAHGATQEDVVALLAMLEHLGFTGVDSQEHDFGRETLATILAAAPRRM
ncbi:MAG: hypothetical protein M1337_02610 [Actinobacteria bacterium]|nr:hypothetical protein [Actinomycetota bacterium]